MALQYNTFFTYAYQVQWNPEFADYLWYVADKAGFWGEEPGGVHLEWLCTSPEIFSTSPNHIINKINNFERQLHKLDKKV